jgi:uncharacterized protein (DUF305 family)
MGVVAAGALLLSACGGDSNGSSGSNSHDMSGMHHGGAGASASARTGDFNNADVMFAQEMIPHRDQAMEMGA